MSKKNKLFKKKLKKAKAINKNNNKFNNNKRNKKNKNKKFKKIIKGGNTNVLPINMQSSIPIPNANVIIDQPINPFISKEDYFTTMAINQTNTDRERKQMVRNNIDPYPTIIKDINID